MIAAGARSESSNFLLVGAPGRTTAGRIKGWLTVFHKLRPTGRNRAVRAFLEDDCRGRKSVLPALHCGLLIAGLALASTAFAAGGVVGAEEAEEEVVA